MEIVEVPIDLIDPLDPPMRRLDWEVIQDLEQSIRTYGVLQPILVRPKHDRYEVVFGNHRYYAVRRIEEITTIPVIVKNIPDSVSLLLALTENIQRTPMNPYDEGSAYKRILDEKTVNIKTLSSQHLNKSVPYIIGRIRVFESLHPELVEKIGKGINITNALFLSKLSKEKQLEVYEKIETIKDEMKPKQVSHGGGGRGLPPTCECPKCGSIHFRDAKT